MVMNNKKPVCFAELKTRKNASTQYPTLMLSLNKWKHGTELAKTVNVPFIVIAKWTDGIFFLNASKTEVEIGIGGRQDRGDNQDIEPVVFMKVTDFKKA
jgi:hypothetical protein